VGEISEVLGEVGVGLEGGQGGGLQVLVCIGYFRRKSKEIGGKCT